VPGYRLNDTFGGIKDSGLGYKEGVLEAMKSSTNVKTISSVLIHVRARRAHETLRPLKGNGRRRLRYKRVMQTLLNTC